MNLYNKLISTLENFANFIPKAEVRYKNIPLQDRRISRPQPRQPFYQRPLAWVGLGLGAGAIAAGGYGFYRLESSLPGSGTGVSSFARQDTLVIRGSDGTILQATGPVTYEEVDIDNVPDIVKQAFIAIEDRRFYEHGGVDPQGTARALVANVQAQGTVEGGSTITQQVARMVYLDPEQTLWRKLREMRMAQRIEHHHEKDEILEHYLNLVYLGSNAYGVAEAAWVYFSKPLSTLTVAEAATIAGLAPAPSVYSPLENPDLATSRRNEVLRRMQEDGYITEEEAAEAIASPIELNPSSPRQHDRVAPHFTDYVQEQLNDIVSPDVLQAGGVVVETSLNPQWQEAAERTIEETIQNYGGYQRFEQASLVAIDPRNGEIRAMVGGNDYLEHQFNRVTQAKRQPGSTFKTFVYATAIAAGGSPNQSFIDAPYTVDGYSPRNYGDRYRGTVTMQQALTESVNTVAVRTLVDVGWDPIIETAHNMGIRSELSPFYSLALGASEATLLELTSAYGTLANRGVHQEPVAIRRVLDREGNVIYESESASRQALDEESSAIMTSMLQDVVENGTGRSAQIGRPAAGKTGTSDGSRDLWYIGYIPQLVTGVWLGNDDSRTTSGASTTAATAWGEFMGEVVEDMEVENLPERPANVDNRVGTIQAQPIQPQYSYYDQVQASLETNGQ